MMLLKLMSLLFLAVLHCSSVSTQFSFSQPTTGPTSVCEGSNVTLQCRVVFNDNPQNAVWYRNGTSVGVGSNFIPNHNVVLNSTTGARTDLVITDVTVEDDYTVYTCNSTDNSITSSVVLNVTGPPSIGDTTNDTCFNKIMLSWNIISELMACGPVSYNVTISSDGMMLMITTTDTYYNFTGLTPATDYKISIQPSNSAGSGQAFTETIRTSTPSINLTSVASEICLTDALLSWNLISDLTACSSVSLYNLIKYSDGNMTMMNTTNTFYNFTGLTPGTAYTIFIVPLLNMNSSGEGCNHTIMTAPNDALTKVDIEVAEIHVTYITIRIKPMNETFCNGSVNYTTTVEPPHGSVSKVNQTVNNITGLNASTTYTITTTVALRGHEVHNVTLNESTLPLNIVVDSQESDDDTTTIIIMVVVIVVCAGGAGGACVGIVMYKKRQRTKRTVPSKDRCDDDYAEARKTDDAPQEKDNLHYDYAMNGPRGVVFPSTTSGMPQNQ